MTAEPAEISHDDQVTPAHVLELIRSEVIPQLDSLTGNVAELQTQVKDLQETTKEAGLNGHTPYLKAFLEQYAGTYQTRQAWQTVRSDLAHRLGWLRSPKAWLRAIFYAALGGLGWQLVSGGHPFHVG